MSVTTTQPPVVLEPASQEFVEATAKPPFLYELTPAEARKVLDDVQAAPIDKLPVEDRWITVPAEVGDVRVRIVRPPDAAGDAAGDPLHARRRLGARQRRHARPARPRAGRRHRRRRRVRRVRPLAGGALPRRDRAGVRHRPVDRPRGRRQPARPRAHRGRRRLGRRQHDRGAGADGRRARRRALRPAVDVLPGHRRRHGHRLLRAVRGGLLPHREGDGVVLGCLRSGRRAALGAVRLAAPRQRRAARRAPAGVPSSSTRRMSFGTRARPTRPVCGRPESR